MLGADRLLEVYISNATLHKIIQKLMLCTQLVYVVYAC